MKRRAFTALCGAGCLLPGFSPAMMRSKRQRPNILFVFADQLRRMELGCYGGTEVRTPNLDRLAREGVLFSNACSTYPVCSPFRGMLMSGNFPMKNGMVFNDHFLRNPSPYFAEVLKQDGYRTGYIGKWHIDGAGRKAYIPPERRRGFDFWRTLECTHDYFQSEYYRQDDKSLSQWKGYDAISQTKCACDFIQDGKNEESPFCLFMGWGPPHSPYIAPDEYMKRFDPSAIELRENTADFASAEKMMAECDTKLPKARENARRSYLSKMMDRGNKAVREWYRGYYAAIEVLDDCIGQLFQTLENTGQLNHTIVVFTSDHGDNLGSHRQYGKQLPYEESIGIPFMIRYPKKIKAGTKTDALLAPVDIMPTVLSLAGTSCPAVDGKDISSAAMGRDADMQDALLIMRMVWLGTNWITNGSGPWRGVRTKRHTYARKSDSKRPWMLFDNSADPYQMNNLVADPMHAELLKQLDAKTDQLLLEAKDPEDPEVIARLVYDERQKNNRPMNWDVLIPEKVVPGSGFRKLENSRKIS